MAIIKFHKDLLAQEPELLHFVFSEFDKDPLDVTTVQDAINNTEAWLVKGKGVPTSGQLDILIVNSDQCEIPEGATQFKNLYLGKHTGYWQHYD